MKSIVEEASSVVKAIEKGWVLAGKPQEFQVKVFEVEQKNFLGMTTKSAKIAIFYNEKFSDKAPTFRPDHAEKRPYPKKDTPTSTPAPVRKERAPQQETTTQRQQQPKPEEKRREQPVREIWTDEMMSFCQNWLKETLSLMNMPQHTFSVDVKNYYLKINFDTPLLPDSEREKLLFRSFAHLVMQSMRNKFKKGFRGFKVILNSGKPQ